MLSWKCLTRGRGLVYSVAPITNLIFWALELLSGLLNLLVGRPGVSQGLRHRYNTAFHFVLLQVLLRPSYTEKKTQAQNEIVGCTRALVDGLLQPRPALVPWFPLPSFWQLISHVNLAGLWCPLVWSTTNLDVAAMVAFQCGWTFIVLWR